MTKKGKQIASTNDPLGNVVITTSKTWKHIQEGHPEMAGRLDDVQNTIGSAECIRKSTVLDTAFALEKGYSTGTVRVLIDYGTPNLFDGSATGYVSTAYEDTPGIASAVSEIIWEKTASPVEDVSNLGEEGRIEGK